jgi:hypothetical protein
MKYPRQHALPGFPHLAAWCDGRPPIIRMMAKLFVFAAADVNWGVNNYTNNRLFETTTLPSDPIQIMRIYRTTREVRTRMIAAVLNSEMQTAHTIDRLWSCLRRFFRLPPTKMQKMMAARKPWHIVRAARWIAQFEHQFDQMLKNMRLPAKPTPAEIALLKGPHLQVFARIMVPIYLTTGLWPCQLLRKARQGDTKALLKLLRYDRSAIWDPKICVLMQHWGKSEPATFSRITKHLNLRPSRRIKLIATRYHLSAMLRLFAKWFQHLISTRELLGLWDAYDDDCGNVDLKDRPPTDEDAMKKGMKYHLATRAPIELPQPIE